MTLPASYWTSRGEWARDHERMQHYSADHVSDRNAHPDDPWAPALFSRLAELERLMAEAYAEYATWAETAGTNTQLVSLENEHTFGGRSYDVRRCSHGCCVAEVCAWVGDCPHARPDTTEELAAFYQDGAA